MPKPVHNLASPVGLTLLEVVVALGILSLACLSTLQAFVAAERFNTINREQQAALYACEEVINEIRGQQLNNLSNYDLQTRPVDLGNGRNYRAGFAQASVNTNTPAGSGYNQARNELAIFIIHEESPNEGHYGYVDTKTFVDSASGDGSGATYVAGTSRDFPIDLNFNGASTDVLDATAKAADPALLFPLDMGGNKSLSNETLNVPHMRLVPVVVACRWQSAAGVPLQLQIFTLIGDRLGGF